MSKESICNKCSQLGNSSIDCVDENFCLKQVQQAKKKIKTSEQKLKGRQLYAKINNK